MRTSAEILEKTEFPWIAEDVVIRFIDRKHINVLYAQLAFPVLFLIIALISGMLLRLNLGVFFAVSIVIAALWSVWLWLSSPTVRRRVYRPGRAVAPPVYPR